jgi:hypothetical protein
MSKIDASGIEHGKRGGKVYQEVRGQQIVKNLYKPTNPRSPKQQQHRAKLAFINRLSAHLAEAVNIGFARAPDADVKHTPRNAFVKKNWDNGALQWNEETGVWELCPKHLKVADGPRYVPDNMTAEVSDGRLYITCPDPGVEEKNAVADERMLVLVYWPEASVARLYSGPSREECFKFYFVLPDDLCKSGGAMHVYAWFWAPNYHAATDGHDRVFIDYASPSRYLGTFG